MGLTERLARSSSRHPWRTFAAWIGAIVAALALTIAFLPGNLTTNGHVTGNPESKQAEDLYNERFPPDRRGVDELIAVRSPTRTVDDAAFRSFVQSLVRKGDATGAVYHASTYYDAHDPALVSRGRGDQRRHRVRARRADPAAGADRPGGRPREQAARPVAGPQHRRLAGGSL